MGRGGAGWCSGAPAVARRELASAGQLRAAGGGHAVPCSCDHTLHACTTPPLCQVCDALEDAMAEGGCLVDYHGCDFFPER